MTIAGVTRQFYKKFSFVVEESGIRVAAFRSVSDIRIQVAKIEYSEGGALIPNKSAGPVTVPDVTMTRGATDSLDLWNWMQQVVAAGGILAEPDYKRTLDLVQLTRSGTELRRWTLVNYFPIDFKAGDWDNEADENVIEEVILAYDYPIVGGDAS